MKIAPIIVNNIEEDVIDYSKFIVDAELIGDDLDNFVDGNIDHGFTLGIDLIDNHVVEKKNEFYGIVGKKGRGKTTQEIFKQLCHSIANNLIYVVAFQENSPWSMQLNYMNYLLCDFAKEVRVKDPELYTKAKDFINKHFYFLKVETIKEALETTRYLIEEKEINVHGVFLDPINSFDSGYYNSGNSFKDMVDTSKKILRHANDICSVYVSQHPTMSGQRQDADVNSYDAEGGAVLNKASFTYSYNRDKGSNETRLAVDNVRNKHTGGNETGTDEAIIIHWSPTRIDLSLQHRSDEREQDIIGQLKRKHNPLNEDRYNKSSHKFEEKQPETTPTATLSEAFGDPEEGDTPF